MVPVDVKPYFRREQITRADVVRAWEEAKVSCGPDDPWTKKLAAFAAFLAGLDWGKTAIYYEEHGGPGGSGKGWRVVHFIDKVDELWHTVWSHTWFGLGATMY